MMRKYERRNADTVVPRARRILVVEDNPITQLVAAQQLKVLSYPYQDVSDGAAALVAYELRAFDLILIDCRLPDMDGYQTVRAIRAFDRRSERRRAPIVAVTGDSDAECVDKCCPPARMHILKNP